MIFRVIRGVSARIEQSGENKSIFEIEEEYGLVIKNGGCCHEAAYHGIVYFIAIQQYAYGG